MARATKRRNGDDTGGSLNVEDYRHDATRKNNPEAMLAASGRLPPIPRITYAYSPRLDPILRSDPTGKTDFLGVLLAEARKRPLTAEETDLLAEALRHQQPWLEWAGKRERLDFVVDPVALHIHERVSAQAILRSVARTDVTRDLFADPQLPYREAVKFYQHDVDWSNRLILGDSLQVMASLSTREDLAGKVQMVYLDPPYGIRFGSNFQPEAGNPTVTDKEADLTREPEMVRAYRDTWRLGVHSYIAYLRDRLIAARSLINPAGSIFVQIGDENVHLVRSLMDEVFGAANFCSLITVSKTAGQSAELLSGVSDYLLWYAKDIDEVKFRQPYNIKTTESDQAGVYRWVREESGAERRATQAELADQSENATRVFRLDNITSQRPPGSFPVFYEDGSFPPGKGYWKTGEVGMKRLIAAERVRQSGKGLAYVRFFDDFAATSIGNLWTDTGTGSFTDKKLYVVQTGTKIVQRCMLMTTDPGDLVLDPTCGSGTTPSVAERWGRRWIAIDTSRVSVAITRQRMLTERFEYYRIKDPEKGIRGGLILRSIPHITLKSIASNAALDAIFAKHDPILDALLAAANHALTEMGSNLRQHLAIKLVAKQKADGRNSITDADQRRWSLPVAPTGFKHWTIPFDNDPDYPERLSEAVSAYRHAYRARAADVNAAIAIAADPEELADQPEVIKGIVRVSGPFTVEAVQPAETSLDEIAPTSPIGDAPDALPETFNNCAAPDGVVDAHNAEAYLDQMIRLLRMDGVRFPDNKVMKFSRLDVMTGKSSALHADGRWHSAGESDTDPEGEATVAVAFGPQYGPVTAKQVEQLIRAAARRGYDALVVAGFAFDGAAQAVLEDDDHPALRIHMAHIRPDVNPGMKGLLKDTPASQLFTVFGQPRTRLDGPDKNGDYRIVMEGVDIYDPVQNTVTGTRADKVAAWFLDTDYDGRTFCITQAFFPDRSAWSKLAIALRGMVADDAFEALSGTTSLPFKPGPTGCAAIKVIDSRGNEVMRLHHISAGER